MRKQIKLTFQIGYSEACSMYRAFEEDVVAVASGVCGGCTTRISDGWWKEDGAERKVTFSGPLHKERCFELELTCEPAKEDTAYMVVAQGIAEAAQRRHIRTDWVHVSRVQMIGKHFSIKDLIAQNEAAKAFAAE